MYRTSVSNHIDADNFNDYLNKMCFNYLKSHVVVWHVSPTFRRETRDA